MFRLSFCLSKKNQSVSVFLAYKLIMRGAIRYERKYENATNTLIPNIEVPEITTDNVDEVINEIQENEINNLEYDEDMSSVLEADVYNDSEDNRYIFDEKKGLTGYSIDYESINVQENENLSINNANKMAMQYLSSLISNSAEYIQQLADFNEETFVYTYCFNKFKSGIKTTDMVVISFDMLFMHNIFYYI